MSPERKWLEYYFWNCPLFRGHVVSEYPNWTVFELKKCWRWLLSVRLHFKPCQCTWHLGMGFSVGMKRIPNGFVSEIHGDSERGFVASEHVCFLFDMCVVYEIWLRIYLEYWLRFVFLLLRFCRSIVYKMPFSLFVRSFIPDLNKRSAQGRLKGMSPRNDRISGKMSTSPSVAWSTNVGAHEQNSTGRKNDIANMSWINLPGL